MKRYITRQAANLPGWRTDRKIVVFESDDWGSIRMPSKKIYQKLLNKNIKVDRSVYDTYDILEQREDLELFFDTLSGHKDRKGKHPIFTFNTVMGNPAFDRIKEDQFQKYYHEDLETSYLRYNGDNIFDLWQYAMDEKLIQPQFHAREHLNVSLWLEALKNKQHETCVAFDYNFFGLKTNTPSPHQQHYLAAYWPSDERDFNRKSDILKEGLEMFRSKFGFRSESFVACNYVFPVELENAISEFGVKYIQTQRGHVSPDFQSGKTKVRRHFTGKRNSVGQYYLTRNCTFEPTPELHKSNDTVECCMKEITAAFRWKKPAIISTHRINYVGGLTQKNRDRGLNKLDELLTGITDRWPQVEFMSTTELGKAIWQS